MSLATLFKLCFCFSFLHFLFSFFVSFFFSSSVHNEFNHNYDVSAPQWITSCHKNRMTTRVITFWRIDVTSFTTSVSTLRFLIEILSILKAIKSSFKGSYDKQNLTLVVISYEIYETSRSSFHKFHMK